MISFGIKSLTIDLPYNSAIRISSEVKKSLFVELASNEYASYIRKR